MNINYDSSNSGYRGNPPMLLWGRPGGVLGGWAESEARRMRIEKEVEKQYGPKRDKREPPRPSPKNTYAVVGLIVGGVLGGVGGWFIGWLAVIFLTLGGILLGNFAGVYISNYIRKRRESKNIEITKEDKPDYSGPFLKP